MFCCLTALVVALGVQTTDAEDLTKSVLEIASGPDQQEAVYSVSVPLTLSDEYNIHHPHHHCVMDGSF